MRRVIFTQVWFFGNMSDKRPDTPNGVCQTVSWLEGCKGTALARAHGLRHSTYGETLMIEFIANPLFWNKKVKLAVLALATFAALC